MTWNKVSLILYLILKRSQILQNNCQYVAIYKPRAAKGEATIAMTHNGCDGVSNHQLHECLLNRLFWRISKKTSKLRVIGPSVGNSPVTGEFPAQMASNAENVSIWWRHHDTGK